MAMVGLTKKVGLFDPCWDFVQADGETRSVIENSRTPVSAWATTSSHVAQSPSVLRILASAI